MGHRTRSREPAKRRGRKASAAPSSPPAPSGPGEQEGFPPLDFKTFPYRTALANWPDEWRERWGHRANALEEQGLDWQEAEARAFFEIQEERRAEVGATPLPLFKPSAERN